MILNNTCDFLYYLPDLKKLESKEFSVRLPKSGFCWFFFFLEVNAIQCSALCGMGLYYIKQELVMSSYSYVMLKKAESSSGQIAPLSLALYLSFKVSSLTNQG